MTGRTVFFTHPQNKLFAFARAGGGGKNVDGIHRAGPLPPSARIAANSGYFSRQAGGGGQPKTSGQSISWAPLNSQAQKMPPPFEFVNQINKRQQAGRTGDAA